MSELQPSSSEYWMLQSFQALQKGDSDSARVFAEKAVEINGRNVDANFLLLTALIQKIENPSIHKLETNRDKASKVIAMLRQRKEHNELTDKQEQKLRELVTEFMEFYEYVEHKIHQSENDSFWI